LNFHAAKREAAMPSNCCRFSTSNSLSARRLRLHGALKQLYQKNFSNQTTLELLEASIKLSPTNLKHLEDLVTGAGSLLEVLLNGGDDLFEVHVPHNHLHIVRPDLLSPVAPRQRPASSEFAIGGVGGTIDPQKFDRILISDLKSPPSPSTSSSSSNELVIQECVKEVESFFFSNQESRVFLGWSRENGLRNLKGETIFQKM
jgi:hypothetical protein